MPSTHEGRESMVSLCGNEPYMPGSLRCRAFYADAVCTEQVYGVCRRGPAVPSGLAGGIPRCRGRHAQPGRPSARPPAKLTVPGLTTMCISWLTGKSVLSLATELCTAVTSASQLWRLAAPPSHYPVLLQMPPSSSSRRPQLLEDRLYSVLWLCLSACVLILKIYGTVEVWKAA